MMNTPAKILTAMVCIAVVAVGGGITMSRSHRSQREVKVDARKAVSVTEPVHVERRRSRAMRLPDAGAGISSEAVAVEGDSGSLVTLEDPDEIRAWARNNPQRAWEWLVSAQPGAKRDTVAEMACMQIAETNAEVAVMLADRFGAGCSNVLENLMGQWADRDLQAAYTWAVAKPPGAQRDNLLGRIAFVESKTDPSDAARLVADQIPPGRSQDEAAISVLYQWALKDPDAAMNWARSFSAGTLHDRAVNEVQNVMASIH